MNTDHCPRPGCTQPVIRNHDELFCMVHGTLATPKRSWDMVSFDAPPEVARQRHSRVNQKTGPIRQACPVCRRLVRGTDWTSHMWMHGASAPAGGGM